MPKWENISDIAGPNTKTLWNNWWNNLYTHEKGHWDINVTYAQKCKEWADKIKGIKYTIEVCCGNNQAKAKQEALKIATEWRKEMDEKMTSELNQLWTEHNTKQSQYDENTRHGATQGVNFGNNFMQTIDQ
jgi:predicted secreted Zn-dependent protease